MPRVLIVHNAVAADASAAERDVLAQVAVVQQACREHGYACESFACTSDLQPLIERVTTTRPAVVFNLVEALAGRDQLAWLIPALLETLHIPCTGTPAVPLNLSNDKLRTKQKLQLAGLPTPAWFTAESLADSKSANQFVPGQYILKAIGEHASLGLDDSAVVQVDSATALQEQLQKQTARLGKACFAEQFIAGREFNISVLASGALPEVLPPAEIDFSDFPAGKPRIVGQAAKWDEGTFEFDHTPRKFDFSANDAPLLERLRSLSRSCWQVLELAGWARVDFRVDEQNQPWILEVNTNCCLSPDAGFAAAVERGGYTLSIAVERIIAAVLAPSSSRPATTSPTKANKVELRTDPSADDEAHVRDIVDSTGLFRPNEVDVAAELVRVRMRDGLASGYEFVFAEQNGEVLGYACYGLNTVTLASYDLYWIAVRPNLQGQGIGRQLLAEVEQRVASASGKQIYIETSHRADYAATRAFYERCGYALEGVLRDYYAPGDDRAIYVRRW
ncbi:GNAT family N-acetyltransferase [Anatilimnocola floriformis]|uniref:GNAT family N-acetyltransferase n=1 Tax=Anatilimnocola floriformis TaxID=2948575 RepID=UPI0020C2235A|nr:GNAT family N-acetyltransferase [Anatilimnocola floriformis]